MAIDTGARSGGRAASRIGPTHTSTRAPVTRAARSYQRTVGDSSQRVNLGNPRLTTAQRIASVPPKRKASLQAALHRVLRSYNSRSVSGFTPEQNATLKTVLGVGTSMGATPKEKLSAIETGLVETHFTNPNEANSDGTSAGWRQETQQPRYGSEARRMNPKPTAKDYFSETRSAGRGAGMTAGQLSQRVQGSAHPARYDQVQGQAKQILKKADAPPPNPKDVHKLQKAGIPTRGSSPSKKPAAAKRYSNPIPSKAWSQSRTDEGVDFAPKTSNAPIRALGDATFVGKGQGPGWADGGGGGTGDGLVYKLHNSKGLPSPYIFVYEGLRSDPHLRPGQKIKRGQIIGQGVQGGSIEIGFAKDSSGAPLNQDTYSEGQVTRGGTQFQNLLSKLPGSSATKGNVGSFPGGGSSGSAVGAYASSTGQTRSQATRTLSKMTPRQRATALRTALNKTLRGYGGLDSASHSSSSQQPLTRVSGKPVV